MKRMFVSDLHIGDRGSHFKDAIEAIKKENPNELYLIGDILDLWKDKQYKIEDQYPDFFRFLKSLKIPVTYIVGNHDECLNRNRWYFDHVKFVDNLDIPAGDKIIRVIHGHEYDFMFIEFYPVSRILNYIHKIFLRYLHIDLRYLRFGFSSKQKKNIGLFKRIVGLVEERAIKDNRNCSFLVMGHTHLPKKAYIDKVKYINTGDWLTNRSYATEEDGIFKLEGVL